MIDDSKQIDQEYDQQKVEKCGQPERTNKDKEIRQVRKPKPFEQAADNVRKRQKDKQRCIQGRQCRMVCQRLAAADKDVIIRQSINAETIEKKKRKLSCRIITCTQSFKTLSRNAKTCSKFSDAENCGLPWPAP